MSNNMRSVRVRGGSELGTAKSETMADVTYLLPVTLRNQLKIVLVALRRRQLVGSLPCAKAAVKILRLVVANGKFPTTELMMSSVRAVGRELMQAAPSELSIGNVVRRVLFMIREEYSGKLREFEFKQKASQLNLKPLNTIMEPVDNISDISPVPESSSVEANNSRWSTNSQHALRQDSSGMGGAVFDDKECEESFVIGEDLASASLNDSNELEHVPLGKINTSVDTIVAGHRVGKYSPAIKKRPGQSPLGSGDMLASAASQSDLLDLTMQPSLGSLISRARESEADFSKIFPDFKQSVIGAVNEYYDEMESMFVQDGPICEQAQDHVHSDECVLVYGYSSAVDLFLKAAGRDSKFQVVIAEAEPGLSGLQLAKSLSKVPNIAITLIPDSAIFAIMSRVNKVIFSPLAVMADGGSLCSSGLHMVAIAAKEYSVPVVGVTGSFCITPLFSHNQSSAIGQLLSPSSVLTYNAPVNFDNVEVFAPAFDHLAPELIELYVTNSGSHVPSYIYRILSEMYHSDDYSL